MLQRILFFNTIFCLSLVAQSNWIWQNPMPVGKNLNASVAFDSLTCYAAGDAGAFIKTTDGGKNWVLLNAPDQYDILSLSFINTQTGIAGCARGVVLRTTDGGATFTAAITDSIRDVKSVLLTSDGKVYGAGDKGLFIKSDDGGISWSRTAFDTLSFAALELIQGGAIVVVGESGVIYRSNNGGANWNLVRRDDSQTLSAVKFKDNQNGWALGRNGLGLKSTDGGTSWQQINTETTKWIKTVSVLPSGRLFAAGAPGLLIKSDDDGNSWVRSGDSSKFSINTSAFADGRGWVFGNNGLTIATSDAGNSWEFQSQGSENTINSVRFLDEYIGTAVGDSGIILRTEDGGDTWVRQYTGYNYNLNDLFFLNQYQGWIVGDHGTIFQTLDKGEHWEKQNLSMVTSEDIYSIEGTAFANKAVGAGGTYLVSSNSPSGAVWGRGSAPLKSYRGIYTLSSKSATLIGDGGTIIQMTSVPGGSGIKDLSIDSKFDLRDIYFTPEKKGWIVGKYGIVLYSSNQGGKWTILDTLPVTWLNTVYFYDTLNGYTAGSYGSLFKSNDGGHNWSKIHTGVTNTFKKSFFFNKDEGWLVGTYGLLMKTVNGGGSSSPTGVKDAEDVAANIPKEFELHQNYPNPFNPVTVISFDLPAAGRYKLSIFDILGKEAEVLLDDELQPGHHFVSFDAHGLPSGVYFYKLSGNGSQNIKKMILLK